MHLTNITKIRNSCPSNKYLKGFEYIKPSSSIQNTQEINIFDNKTIKCSDFIGSIFRNYFKIFIFLNYIKFIFINKIIL